MRIFHALLVIFSRYLGFFLVRVPDDDNIVAVSRQLLVAAAIEELAPFAAFGFLGVIALNSVLQSLPFIPADGLKAVTDGINSFDTFLLTMAMTALGAETSIDKFKQAGAKPFVLAALIYVWLLVGGYAIVRVLL